MARRQRVCPEGRRPGEFVGVFAIDRAVPTMVPYTRDTEAVAGRASQRGDAAGLSDLLAGDMAGAASSSPCRSGMSDEVRASETLKGLQAVAGTLAHLPGRKNIVLFSEGFLVPTDSNAPDIFQRLTAGANRSTVTFHTIDAAGPRIGRPRGLGLDPTPYLEQLARDTGGQYISGTNDLAGGRPPADGRHARLLPAHLQPHQHGARRPLPQHHREGARDRRRGDLAQRLPGHPAPREARWCRRTTSRRTCCSTRRNCRRTSRSLREHANRVGSDHRRHRLGRRAHFQRRRGHRHVRGRAHRAGTRAREGPACPGRGQRHVHAQRRAGPARRREGPRAALQPRNCPARAP